MKGLIPDPADPYSCMYMRSMCRDPLNLGPDSEGVVVDVRTCINFKHLDSHAGDSVTVAAGSELERVG